MAGYVRQAAANISNGNLADADDVDLEFDALAAAFSGISGHLHDGATGNGPKINLTTSVVGVLPLANGGTGLSDLTSWTITSTDDSASLGPYLTIFRNSASPAINDFIGTIEFAGKDSGGGTDTYARIFSVITDPTSGSEDGALYFQTMINGSITTNFAMTDGEARFNLTPVPVANDIAALGTTAKSWSDLFLASGAVINFNNGDVTVTHSTEQLTFAGAALGYNFDARVYPATNGGAALGTPTVSWSNLYIASTGSINFANSDVIISHGSNTLAFAGATSGYQFLDGPIRPAGNDGVALGTPGVSFSDLYLASGGIIGFNNGDVLIQHTSNQLSITGGVLYVEDGVLFGPSANPNALDYYEEGTFTPTIQGTTTAGTGTYSTQAGTYTRIGNRILFEIQISWTAHTGTGNMLIAGLPFTANVSAPCAIDFSGLTYAAGPQATVATGTSTILLRQTASGAGITGLPMDTSATLLISGCYRVA